MHQQPLSGQPVEDAGAKTADRFRFQYCCAAARVLAAIAQRVACEVICEWHEDYLVLRADGGIEAVSVKHRENHLPAWTRVTLTGEAGKLGHLLETFQRAGGQIDCCFESNRAHRVSDLCSEDLQVRADARSDLARRLSVSTETVDTFLARLTIAEPVPDRRDIEATFAIRYAVPALDALNITGLAAAEAMRIACDLIAGASAERLTAEAAVAVLAAAPGQRQAIIEAQVLVDRRVSDQDLAKALRKAASSQAPRLWTVPGDVPPESTMTKKLVDGGLGPSTVDTARRRRRVWFSHVAQYRDIAARQQELASLKEWVQDQANAAENMAMASGTKPYGREMHDELVTRISTPGAVPAGTRDEDRDPALLTGAAYQLTDECTVWFAPRSPEHTHA